MCGGVVVCVCFLLWSSRSLCGFALCRWLGLLFLRCRSLSVLSFACFCVFICAFLCRLLLSSFIAFPGPAPPRAEPRQRISSKGAQASPSPLVAAVSSNCTTLCKGVPREASAPPTPARRPRNQTKACNGPLQSLFAPSPNHLLPLPGPSALSLLGLSLRLSSPPLLRRRPRQPLQERWSSNFVEGEVLCSRRWQDAWRFVWTAGELKDVEERDDWQILFLVGSRGHSASMCCLLLPLRQQW